MVEKEEAYNSSGVKGECLDDPSTDTDDQKDAHRSCTEWDHCERCRDTKYSFAAVIARLEREAKKEARQQKKLQQRILWERTDEALLDRRIKFCKRFGIDAYKFEVTPGEKRLARDTILGKWQCKSRSPLRKCWTMVRYQAKQGSRSLRK
ncbi:hypothetical protein B0O99DRAFT_630933 [Bisporella sp. PMI_857]|nr:hypothetical protein B0O99DRAFT_630933 [Bisporella sp. PMI_857]